MFSLRWNLQLPSLLPLTLPCVRPKTGQMNSPYTSMSRSPTKSWTPPTESMLMMSVASALVSQQTLSNVCITGTP
eukprot:8032462-Heterocapsa_arctica.AAC.1